MLRGWLDKLKITSPRGKATSRQTASGAAPTTQAAQAVASPHIVAGSARPSTTAANAPARQPVASRWLAVIALQTALIIALTWALVYFARDEYNAVVKREEEEINTASRVTTKEGAARVALEEGAQQANGIETRPLESVSHSSAVQAYGSVVDLAPLLDSRLKYVGALDEAALVRTQIARSEAEYARANALYRDERSVAQRVVDEARAALKSDQARLAAANRVAAELSANMRQQWGSSLAQWASLPQSADFARVLKKQDMVVRIALQNESKPPATLQVAAVGAGSEGSTAKLIGAAPTAEAQFSGATYFYRVESSDLRVGMQVAARVNEEQAAQTGVIIPHEAVVWHGGKAWIYVREGDDAFVRRVVATEELLPSGWFSSEFKAGQEVVVSGAQLLLSEEFRYQIRNENDD